MRIEQQPGRAEANRTCSNDPNTALAGFAEQQATGFEGEEINRVDHQIDIVQKLIDVFFSDVFTENVDFQLGIDTLGRGSEHIDFRHANGFDRGSKLPIEVLRFKFISVGNPEFTYAHSREGHQVVSTHTSHAGNRHPTFSQSLLFLGRNQSKISRNRIFIVPIRGLYQLCFKLHRRFHIVFRSIDRGIKLPRVLPMVVYRNDGHE